MAIAPAVTPEAALAMDACYAIALCGARVRRMATPAAAPAADGGFTEKSDASGRKTIHVTSLEGLGKAFGRGLL